MDQTIKPLSRYEYHSKPTGGVKPEPRFQARMQYFSLVGIGHNHLNTTKIYFNSSTEPVIKEFVDKG